MNAIELRNGKVGRLRLLLATISFLIAFPCLTNRICIHLYRNNLIRVTLEDVVLEEGLSFSF